ncbi:MAG: S41 family peptidase [Chloroflexi bacterium]|jgi:carboxyl-terminal processing protease|nr:S41 family peptidase [Chloroflexota bacterium]
MSFLRSFLFMSLAILLVIASFTAGYLFHQQQVGRNTYTLFDEAKEILETHGLKAPPAAPRLEYGMIRGMLQAYDDPYTIFLEPPQNELESNRLEGKYGGIGAQLEQDEQGNWTLYPYPDSPAQQAGLQDGDRLITVEDLDITPQTTADVLQAALRGPVGEAVRLSIGRAPDFTPISFTITRQEIALPSVTWRLAAEDERLGILKVNLIAASTPEEIQRAIEDLQQRGASAFVLDLRDNPGGLLDAGVDVARLFLKEGVVMQQQYRGQQIKTFEVEKPGPLVDLPLAVLINKGSASAAEISAGALQAHHRAELIGEPSYGKDTIQLVFTLQDGSSLHVTSAHWWIPGLETPVGPNGLQPDILIDPAGSAPGSDPYLQAAIRRLFGAS